MRKNPSQSQDVPNSTYISCTDSYDSGQISSSLFLHLWSNDSPKSDVMLFTAISALTPLEEQGKDCSEVFTLNLSLCNNFFSTFTTSLRSKADLMTSKAKGRLSYLYRENAPSLPIFSFSRQECFNTWVPAAQGQSSTFSAIKPKEVFPISLTQSPRIKVFCLWFFSSWQPLLFYFPPPCLCSETQFHR